MDVFLCSMTVHNCLFLAVIYICSYITTELSEESKDHVTYFMNQLNTEIEKMRSSNDTNSKKGAILAIGLLFVFITLSVIVP